VIRIKRIPIKIFSDGGARGNPGPAACAFVAVKSGKVVYSQAKFLGKTTNNVAEYNGLLIALTWLFNNQKLFTERVINIYLDSQLVVQQLNGSYKIKNLKIKPLAFRAKNLERLIKNKVNYFFVPRSKNKLADALLNKKIDENI